MIKTALFLLLLPALAAFEYRDSDPAALFPYYTATGDAHRLCAFANPAYLPLLQAGYLRFTGARPYGLEEMKSGGTRAGYSGSAGGLQAAWNRLAIEGYSEDTLELNGGIAAGRYLSAGVGASCYRLAVQTEELRFSRTLWDGRASLLLRPASWISLGLLQDNIASFRGEERGLILHPETSAGMALKPVTGLTFTWNINRTYFAPVNTLAVSAHLLEYLSFSGGYSRETQSWGASLSLVIKNLLVVYGLRYHTYLGVTHSFGVTVTDRRLTYERLKYATRPFERHLPAESGKKVAINRCSLEELKGLPSLPPHIAERIIRYRQLIGPVSRDSLLQIGLSEKEVAALEPCLVGLADHPPEAPNAEKKSSYKKYKLK